MSALSFEQSQARARVRFGRSRATRSDQGTTRFSVRVEAELRRLLYATDRPAVTALARQLQQTCKRWGEPAPSRASLYNAIKRLPAPQYPVSALPQAVRNTLLNIDSPEVGGAWLVFYAFNHGSLEALSFAAALPWICLQQATTIRGWRPKSYALLQAVLDYREI